MKAKSESIRSNYLLCKLNAISVGMNPKSQNFELPNFEDLKTVPKNRGQNLWSELELPGPNFELLCIVKKIMILRHLKCQFFFKNLVNFYLLL